MSRDLYARTLFMPDFFLSLVQIFWSDINSDYCISNLAARPTHARQALSYADWAASSRIYRRRPNSSRHGGTFENLNPYR